MLHMIGHAIVGLLIGICAKVLLPGHDPGGLMVPRSSAWPGASSADLLVARSVGIHQAIRPAS